MDNDFLNFLCEFMPEKLQEYYVQLNTIHVMDSDGCRESHRYTYSNRNFFQILSSNRTHCGCLYVRTNHPSYYFSKKGSCGHGWAEIKLKHKSEILEEALTSIEQELECR